MNCRYQNGNWFKIQYLNSLWKNSLLSITEAKTPSIKRNWWKKMIYWQWLSCQIFVFCGMIISPLYFRIFRVTHFCWLTRNLTFFLDFLVVPFLLNIVLIETVNIFVSFCDVFWFYLWDVYARLQFHFWSVAYWQKCSQYVIFVWRETIPTNNTSHIETGNVLIQFLSNKNLSIQC